MSEFVSRVAYRGVSHEPAAPTVELSHVSVVYAGVHAGKNVGQNVGQNGGAEDPAYALDDISCHILAGERVAVVGPNGAGKSTLFKLIVGTLKPSSGSVQVYGHGPAGHICIGYVPQRNQLDWSFPVTVEDVVMMGRAGQIGLFRWPRRRDREQVRSSLAMVDATHLAKRQIGELSGGQQQRVFIARALAQEAELLLLDEPLTGLDSPSQEKIFVVLDRLRDEHVTVVVATHDLDMAAERFDRILLLNRRMIAFNSPPEALAPENLIRAYGGQLHRLPGESDLLIADDCCGEEH